MATASFKLFPKLPTEIRIKIWTLSLNPRTIEIAYDPATGFRSRAPDPLALLACRESREATVRAYPQCFGSFFHPAMTRVNLSLDTIYIDRELEEYVPHFFSTFREREISELQYLAFTARILRRNTWIEWKSMGNTVRAVAALKGLKELICVFDVRHCARESLVPNCKLWYGEGVMELFDTLPQELQHPWLQIKPLPSACDANGNVDRPEFYAWEAPKFTTAYGWRRVTMHHFFLDKEDL